jgi:hypothetical protein
MKKEIKIDIQDLIEALEDHSDSFNYYLDLENGNVVTLLKDDFEEKEYEDDEESPEEIDGYNREIIENNPDRFMFIEPIESHESFEIMEDFTSELPDDIIKSKLSIALSKRKPFRHFKDELYDFPEVQKEWYKFHEDEMKRIASEWLEAYNINAEFVRKHLMEDK